MLLESDCCLPASTSPRRVESGKPRCLRRAFGEKRRGYRCIRGRGILDGPREARGLDVRLLRPEVHRGHSQEAQDGSESVSGSQVGQLQRHCTHYGCQIESASRQNEQMGGRERKRELQLTSESIRTTVTAASLCATGAT